MTSLYQNPMTNDAVVTTTTQTNPEQQQQMHQQLQLPHSHHHHLQDHHQHHQQQQQHLIGYPELRVVFDFFTDNPQKVLPSKKSGHQVLESSFSLGHDGLALTAGHQRGLGHSSSETGGSMVVADPYWNSIRRMQTDDSFMEGMLLRSVDHKPQYPFLHYIVYKDVSTAQDKSRASLERRDVASRGSRSPDNDLLNALQSVKTKGLYREMCTYVTPDTPLLPKRPTNPNTAFSLSAFKTVGNLDNLDRSWTYWSGADYIVENIPKSLKLERLTFHKLLPTELRQPFLSRAPSLAGFAEVDVCRDSIVASPSSDHGSALWTNGNKDVFSYVLLCEIGEALLDMNRTREFIDTLKYRQCGVTSMRNYDTCIA